jgi:co-chaperonin GroES (HSP10)
MKPTDKIKPAKNKLLIELLEENIGNHKIIIPDNVRGRPSNLAKVIHMGHCPDIRDFVSEGMTIVCNNYYGTDIDYQDKKCKLLNAEDVQAVLEVVAV